MSQMEPTETHVGRESTREETDQPDYWNEIYAESEDNSPGWNLGEANAEFVWQLNDALPKIESGRILVPGCGYGHDAILFAKAGFEVVCVDISEWAVKGARENFAKAGVEVELHHSDLFSLPSSWDGSFDYIAEHTCFCAIHPERRDEYATLAKRLLKPEGQLFGLFYFHKKEGGPPFNTTPEEVRECFEPHFDVRELVEAQHNIEKRRGKELWARMWKREA